MTPPTWGETAGLAATEQTTHGRLVTAADIRGPSEVPGDAGLKFRPGDVNGLCACLRRVLEHPEIVEEHGARARERAQKLFQSERMVEDHRQIYGEIPGSEALFSAGASGKGRLGAQAVGDRDATLPYGERAKH